MIIERIQPASEREEVLLADLSASAADGEDPPLRIAPPRRRFSVSKRYWYHGPSVHLTGPKFYPCPHCRGRTLVSPEAVMPPGQFYYRVNPENGKFEWRSTRDLNGEFQHLLSFDFCCKRCQRPVRLIFTIREERNGKFLPDIIAVLEQIP